MNRTTKQQRYVYGWILAALVMGLAPMGIASALMPQTPMESVQSAIANVMRILTDETLKQPERQAERRRLIEQVVRQRVSYEDMARQALGHQWQDLTAGERQEFVDLFVQLLRDSIAGKIDAYTDEHVVYLSEQMEDRIAQVRTRLAGRKIDTLLDFRLADRAGTWLVYDVVIDGASIVHSYRAQFAHIMRDMAYAGLVNKMRENTLLVKSFETVSSQ